MDEYIDCFAQGPIASKLWLCKELELAIDHIEKPTVNIFGGWVNVLGFMLQVRKPNYYKEINSYDADSESTRLSDKICDAWKFTESKINNITADATKLQFTEPEVFVNCSVDQFEGTSWYDVIPKGSIVCLQTTTLPIENAPWHICQETKSVDELIERYPMDYLYHGELHLPLGDSWYTRLMVIGIK